MHIPCTFLRSDCRLEDLFDPTAVSPPDADLAGRVAQLERDLEALGAMVESIVVAWRDERQAVAEAMERRAADR